MRGTCPGPHSDLGANSGLEPGGLLPRPEQSLGGPVTTGGRANPLQACCASRLILCFSEEKASFYLFVATAVSWILIALHLAMVRHLFPEACFVQRVSFLKTSKLKHK